jgi:hypothetical protein
MEAASLFAEHERYGLQLVKDEIYGVKGTHFALRSDSRMAIFYSAVVSTPCLGITTAEFLGHDRRGNDIGRAQLLLHTPTPEPDMYLIDYALHSI